MYKKLFLVGLLVGVNSFLMAEEKIDPNQFNSLVETCMDLQIEGKLPGVGTDLDSDAVFKSDSISVSLNDTDYYPLKSNCIIDSKNRRYTFTFIKNSKELDWVLVQN